MSDRIRMLEDALQIECGQKHPLLTPELLAVKQGIVTSNNMYDEDSDTEEMRGSFGVLSVDENKSMRFLGATAVEVRIGFHFTSSWYWAWSQQSLLMVSKKSLLLSSLTNLF